MQGPKWGKISPHDTFVRSPSICSSYDFTRFGGASLSIARSTQYDYAGVEGKTLHIHRITIYRITSGLGQRVYIPGQPATEREDSWEAASGDHGAEGITGKWSPPPKPTGHPTPGTALDKRPSRQ
jgi:hypothetical protein